jgi:hypothetical protein
MNCENTTCPAMMLGSRLCGASSEDEKKAVKCEHLAKKEIIMTEKKIRKTTPLGEAKWAHVHTPQAAFVDKSGNAKGAPKFQIDLVFSKDDPQWATWASSVMDMLRALPEQIDKKSGEAIKKQSPIKRELNEADEPTGRFVVTFKTSAKFKPGVFDRYGDPIPENVMIGNGSIVRVSYIENAYSAFGGGINFYLNAIQVADLVEYKAQNAAAYGFPVEDAPAKKELDPWDDQF